uniref:Uncharacterized protein n=1 Tax=Rangifer tarandus platyrhynchus TaxID=3082113 RepID=A0ACB0DX92_RANTA|nr:unnamed protein product [Rangifer tarandus platyrhynchus]
MKTEGGCGWGLEILDSWRSPKLEVVLEDEGGAAPVNRAFAGSPRALPVLAEQAVPKLPGTPRRGSRGPTFSRRDRSPGRYSRQKNNAERGKGPEIELQRQQAEQPDAPAHSPSNPECLRVFRDRIQSKCAASWAGRKRRVLRKQLDFRKVKAKSARKILLPELCLGRSVTHFRFGFGRTGSLAPRRRSCDPRDFVVKRNLTLGLRGRSRESPGPRRPRPQPGQEGGDRVSGAGWGVASGEKWVQPGAAPRPLPVIARAPPATRPPRRRRLVLLLGVGTAARYAEPPGRVRRRARNNGAARRASSWGTRASPPALGIRALHVEGCVWDRWVFFGGGDD